MIELNDWEAINNSKFYKKILLEKEGYNYVMRNYRGIYNSNGCLFLGNVNDKILNVETTRLTGNLTYKCPEVITEDVWYIPDFKISYMEDLWGYIEFAQRPSNCSSYSIPERRTSAQILLSELFENDGMCLLQANNVIEIKIINDISFTNYKKLFNKVLEYNKEYLYVSDRYLRQKQSEMHYLYSMSRLVLGVQAFADGTGFGYL